MATQTNIVQGTTELIRKLQNLGEEGNRLAIASINVVADLIVADAKREAPADLGTIRQGIGKEVLTNSNGVQVKVFSSAPESGYQEFGTGGRVVIPAEMSDVAQAIKGKSSGDFKAFIKALTAWVKRKGIAGVYSVKTRKQNKRASGDADEQAAYMIARSILKKGLKPQPFMYPAYVKNKDKLKPMLEQAYKQAWNNLGFFQRVSATIRNL